MYIVECRICFQNLQLLNIYFHLSLQSEKSKKAGNAPSTTLLVDFLKTSYGDCPDILLLEEDMNFNLRAASLSVSALLLSSDWTVVKSIYYLPSAQRNMELRQDNAIFWKFNPTI